MKTLTGSAFCRSNAGLIAILIGTLQVASPQSGPIIWVSPSLTRVGQNDSPGGTSQATLWAARGEYEPFQVIVRGPSGGLNNVNVAISDLTGPGVISKSNFNLYREQYVVATVGSRDLGGSNRPMGPGTYPDGLIPFNDPNTGTPITGASKQAVPFSLSAGTNQPIWIDLYIPHNVPAGQYSGTVTVTSTQGSSSIPVSLTVWNFDLPLKPSLESVFSIYNPGQEDLVNQEVLIKHKIMPRIVNPADEGNLIDKWGLNITGLWYWTGASQGNCAMPPAPTVSDFAAQKAQYRSEVPVYVYSADEITDCVNIYPTLKQWARNMHAAGVNNLLTAVPIPALQDEGSGSGGSVADYWVLLPKQLVSNAGDVQTVLNKGNKVWSYTAGVQDSYSPKWEIDFAPINYRIMGGFLNESQGLSGLLYWGVNSWTINPTPNPWTNMSYTENGKTYSGEGWLVYPGNSVGIQGFAPSMRLKWIREGVEDYEYVEILKKLGWGSWASQIVKGVASDWMNWSQDPNALESARRQLGQQINQLMGGSPEVPPARFGGSPSGKLAAGTTQATLSLNTNVSATCRYSSWAGVAYSSMPSTFSTTGGTSHASTVTGLQPGGSYSNFVRCQDRAGNANTDDLAIQFGVAQSSGHASGVSTAYEAESPWNILGGHAITMSCPNCSGSVRVGWIGSGNGRTGSLQFNNVNAAASGTYPITIYYVNGDAANRTASMSVNGGPATTVRFPPTGTWDTLVVGSVTATVALNAGSGNTIKFFNNNSWSADLDKIVVGATPPPQTRSYEAESSANVIGEQAIRFNCAICSGGSAVGWIGSGTGRTGSLQFNGISAGATGTYQLSIYYLNGDPAKRTAYISVNGAPARTITFPAAGTWDSPVLATVTTTVTLNAGDANTIRFANPFSWAPDIDRITTTGQ